MLGYIYCDLDDSNTINSDSIAYAVCRFISEVKKLDGCDFPPRTLKDIVLGIQFHLEMKGFTWHLIDDDQFSTIRYTLDNLMKKRDLTRSGKFSTTSRGFVI